MYLYSAHDITVGGLLFNLGVFKRHLPAYGCYISLEVHKIHNVHGIKVEILALNRVCIVFYFYCCSFIIKTTQKRGPNY